MKQSEYSTDPKWAAKLARQETLIEVLAFLDPGKPPCDCHELQPEGFVFCRCYCSNRDDGERAAAWCESKNILWRFCRHFKIDEKRNPSL